MVDEKSAFAKHAGKFNKPPIAPMPDIPSGTPLYYLVYFVALPFAFIMMLPWAGVIINDCLPKDMPRWQRIAVFIVAAPPLIYFLLKFSA